MDHLRQELKKHRVLDRWNLMGNYWEQRLSNVDAVLIKDGIDDEDSPKLKTMAFQQWFYRFEFIKTVQIITKTTLIFMGTKEKIGFLEVLKEEAKTYKKNLIFVEIGEVPTTQNIDQIFNEIQKLNLQKFGVFKKEKQKGKVIELFEQKFQQNTNLEEIDISMQLQSFMSVKNKADEYLLRKAADITMSYFEDFINMIEYYIDEGDKVKHSEISAKMEDKLLRGKKSLKGNFEVLPNFYDFTYNPVVQSGKEYNLKPTSNSNKDYLEHNIILLNMGGKYFEMNCNIFRTLMINPTAEDKLHYQALHFLHRTVIRNLRKGTVLSEVYLKSKNEFEKKYPDLADKLPRHFGFGTGYQFRESLLSIQAKNQNQKVESGNVFMVMTSLKDLKNSNNHEYSIHLSDTILINQNGEQENLTEQIKCSFDDIGYDIEEQQEENEVNRQNQLKYQVNKQPSMSRSEMRRLRIEKEQERNAVIKENQSRLMDMKMQEIKQRIEDGEFDNDTSKSNKIALSKLNAYPDKKLPKLNTKEIHVDEKREVVLFPINNKLVPIHAHCIKNVTKHNERGFYSLRVNFQTPSQGTGGLEFPQLVNGINPLYLKELTFKSSNNESIQNVCRKIKDLLKRLKLEMKLNQKQAQEQKKENLRDKIDSLNDLKMRPTLSGRKTAGHLVAYHNGFKFNAKNNHSFILFNNSIKQAIFQPCDDNLIVIIHFFLKFPVVINKKTTHHVQFYAEVAQGVEDVNEQRRRGRIGRYDEFDEEQMEEEQRRHYNSLFIKFVKNVQNNWSLKGQEFDSPYPELGFYGSPNQNNVFIMPSKYTLMSISERPFFVVMIDEIEVVSIERIDNKIKNFDMIVIFKDYRRPVVNIDNIPKNDLDTIKVWLNDNDILFFEGGAINIKWDKYLKQVLEDPENFLEEGGWKGFVIDSESEDEIDDDDDSEVKSESLEEEVDDDDFEIDDDEFEEEYEDDDYNEDNDEEEYDFDEESEESVKKPKKKKNRK